METMSRGADQRVSSVSQKTRRKVKKVKAKLVKPTMLLA